MTTVWIVASIRDEESYTQVYDDGTFSYWDSISGMGGNIRRIA